MLVQVGCCSKDKCVVVLHAQELGSILVCNHIVAQYLFAAGSAAFTLKDVYMHSIQSRNNISTASMLIAVQIACSASSREQVRHLTISGASPRSVKPLDNYICASQACDCVVEASDAEGMY